MWSEADPQANLKRFRDNHLSDKDDGGQAAAEAYKHWGGRDPFYEEIPSGLLDSAQIMSYVAATGMIHPFKAEPKHLHPASYAFRLKGTCVQWDADELECKSVTEIDKGDDFILSPDSIAFLTLEPVLRIPDYLALRFDLRVPHVYKGLLLGTGPLIDPGYQGRLSIPLHNFTTNPYRFSGGERLIWVEFTKLAACDKWKPEPETSRPTEILQDAVYIPYDAEDYESEDGDRERSEAEAKPAPSRKTATDSGEMAGVEAMLAEAEKHRPVFSSTNQSLERSQEAIEEVEDIEERLRKYRRWFGVGTLVLIVVGVLGVILPLFQYLKTDVRHDDEVRRRVDSLQQRLDLLNTRLERLSSNSRPSLNRSGLSDDEISSSGSHPE